MKKMKNLLALMAAIVLSIVVKAQDAGTYIDSLNVQDSSYMQQDLLAGAEESSSGNTTVIVIVAIVLVAVVAFVIIKKKKK